MFAAQLVVRQKYEAFTLFHEFIAHAPVRVIEVDGMNLNGIDFIVESAFHIVVDGGLKGLKLYGEKRRAHGFAEQFLDVSLGGGASHQVNNGFGMVDGLKKGKSQNMIQVGVGENEVVMIPFLFQENVAQAPNSRSGVDNNDFVVL